MCYGQILFYACFVIVTEALSGEFNVALPWELLYTVDLVGIAGIADNLNSKA